MTTVEELIDEYPSLYHMAEADSWAGIRTHGLLSTSALLDLFDIEGDDRTEIESEWRPESVTITHPDYGSAVIRDQRPMPPDTLGPQLIGLAPTDWYQFLNRKTFFWTSRQRLSRLLRAVAYRNRSHDVLEVDTQALLEVHQNDVTLSPFNSGVSSFGPPFPRNADTFQSIDEFEISAHRDGVVEFAVEYSVPNMVDLSVSVEEWRGNRRIREIWRS